MPASGPRLESSRCPEGFGLPWSEDGLRTPVIATEVRPSQVAGDAAVFVDPLDVGDIRWGLEHVLGRSNIRAQMRMRGLNRAREYTWDRVADRVRKVLTNAEAG
jgi:glycosyltransferase involved in cell wall biosynthesis